MGDTPLSNSASQSLRLGAHCSANASNVPSHAIGEHSGLLTPRFAELWQDNPDYKLGDAVARSLVPLLETTAEHIEHVSREAIVDALAPLHELVARCSSDVTAIHHRVLGDEEPPSNILGCCSGRPRHEQSEQPRRFGSLLPQLPSSTNEKAWSSPDGVSQERHAIEDPDRRLVNSKASPAGTGLVNVQTVDSD